MQFLGELIAHLLSHHHDFNLIPTVIEWQQPIREVLTNSIYTRTQLIPFGM